MFGLCSFIVENFLVILKSDAPFFRESGVIVGIIHNLRKFSDVVAVSGRFENFEHFGMDCVHGLSLDFSVPLFIF